jgi:hypothetical protein
MVLLILKYVFSLICIVQVNLVEEYITRKEHYMPVKWQPPSGGQAHQLLHDAGKTTAITTTSNENDQLQTKSPRSQSGLNQTEPDRKAGDILAKILPLLLLLVALCVIVAIMRNLLLAIYAVSALIAIIGHMMGTDLRPLIKGALSLLLHLLSI